MMCVGSASLQLLPRMKRARSDPLQETSKEGSGRVALYAETSLVLCYTLECNYNSGKQTSTVPPASRDSGRASPPQPSRACVYWDRRCLRGCVLCSQQRCGCFGVVSTQHGITLPA